MRVKRRSGYSENCSTVGAAEQSHLWRATASLVAMPEQLGLPGLGAESPMFRPELLRDPGVKLRGYMLFLAIFPVISDGQLIAGDAARLRDRHGLLGEPLAPKRLHVTLHTLIHFRRTLAQSVIDAAKAAAAGVTCPPLHLVFDRALTFPANDAFVLRCDSTSDEAVARLRSPLTLALRRVGLRPEPSCRPHMTTLYDSRHVAEYSIDPICWTATRFALIVSHVGLHHHQWLGQWSVRGIL